MKRTRKEIPTRRGSAAVPRRVVHDEENEGRANAGATEPTRTKLKRDERRLGSSVVGS